MQLDHYRAGGGEPLVLIHGIGHTWRAWRPMLPLVERDFDVLAVDLPGFGRGPPGTRSSATALGRTLFAGGTTARPWRLDPDDAVEQATLFAQAPGFHATLRHTFDRQPRGLNEIEVPVALAATTSRAPRAEAPA